MGANLGHKDPVGEAAAYGEPELKPEAPALAAAAPAAAASGASGSGGRSDLSWAEKEMVALYERAEKEHREEKERDRKERGMVSIPMYHQPLNSPYWYTACGKWIWIGCAQKGGFDTRPAFPPKAFPEPAWHLWRPSGPRMTEP